MKRFILVQIYLFLGITIGIIFFCIAVPCWIVTFPLRWTRYKKAHRFFSLVP